MNKKQMLMDFIAILLSIVLVYSAFIGVAFVMSKILFPRIDSTKESLANDESN